MMHGCGHLTGSIIDSFPLVNAHVSLIGRMNGGSKVSMLAATSPAKKSTTNDWTQNLFGWIPGASSSTSGSASKAQTFTVVVSGSTGLIGSALVKELRGG